jgi:hypothetical protein
VHARCGPACSLARPVGYRLEDERLASIVCPLCKLAIAVERQGGDIVLTFNIDEWRKRCAHIGGGDPALCPAAAAEIVDALAKAGGGPGGPDRKANGPNS